MGIELLFDIVWGCSSSVESPDELNSSLESVTLTSSGKDDWRLICLLDGAAGRLTRRLDLGLGAEGGDALRLFDSPFSLLEIEELLRVAFFEVDGVSWLSTSLTYIKQLW